MKIVDALKKISQQEAAGVSIVTVHDLSVLFEERGETLSSTVKRLVKAGLLLKVANGLYMLANAKKHEFLLYDIARYLRPGEVNYLSAESVLCNLSIISQQMLDRITVMTTGRSGTFKTPFGTIEFTHTKRDKLTLLKNTFRPDGCPIRFADKHIAVRDLKRIGRNTNMIDWDEFNECDE